MKSSQAVILRRVNEILELRFTGATFGEVRRHATAKGWNLRDRQLWRYVDRADNAMARSLEKDREKLLTFHIAARRGLLFRCLQTNDHATAAQILRDEAELLGLYPAKQHDDAGKLPTRIRFTKEPTDNQLVDVASRGKPGVQDATVCVSNRSPAMA